ncbi:hypothetical protein SCHPADRAFT_852230 [Schizopora paradoxa]|uniref:Trafficking protein particle complex subunit 11 domain-containing protein n=1 Tax=Schizopora paradoxa TaxID=27342 RepID=A0A0H2S9W5_9AGAM|nr:hypothetical protein SCHPADRAFT_852230 [Schizopora paradoxa]
MNSYPAELIVQLAPVMFVAGLDSAANQQRRPQASGTSPPPPAPTAAVSTQGTAPVAGPSSGSKPERDPFAILAARLRDALASQRRPAVWSPEAVRKGKIFQVTFVDKNVQFPPRKLPPPLPEAGQQPQHGPNRSPLSPLHPSSPLFPDGLIAPLWVRKHTALVPSVFVLFLRLYEHPHPPTDTSDEEAQRVYKEERERMEKDRDAELAKEISQRKEGTNERSIKLTVVLLANRGMLDDPSLDSRLSNIRRRATLDARAALFVLTPVTQTELHEFVRSLQGALIDPALEYYTAHSKRVRRKRNRVQQNPSSVSAHIAGQHAPPLRPEGWTVRYEYKMACFAEFRGEDEVALKHFQDSYNALLGLFTSISGTLPARTKRWAEAKVLADCINIKICKLYLYNAEPSLALGQLNSHLRRFAELSIKMWGIGETTYEYWAWVGRQYRVFAELLEQGTLSVPPLTIPTVVPAIPTANTSAGAVPASASTTLASSIIGIGSLNPSTHLMHPGFYYAAAATCAEKRRARFLDALSAVEGADTEGVQQQPGPGFANEKKSDHLGTILELYTKSYELFKKFGPSLPGGPGSPILQPQDNQNQAGQAPVNSFSSGSARFPLWVAYRIALTYFASGRYDMANKFLERITKTYSLRREAWGPLLKPVLSTWYACSQRIGDIDLSVRLAIEMMLRGYPSLGIPGQVADGLDGESMSLNQDDEEDDIVEDLMAVFRSTVPTKQDDPVNVNVQDCEPLLDLSSALFWESTAEVDSPMAFQIALSVPQRENSEGSRVSFGLLAKLPITRVRLSCTPFNREEGVGGDSVDIVVDHESAGDNEVTTVQVVDVGELVYGVAKDSRECHGNAHLRWNDDDAIVVLKGIFHSQTPSDFKFTSGVVTIAEGRWTVNVPFRLDQQLPSSLTSPRWLVSLSPPKFIPMRRNNVSVLRIKEKRHDVNVKFIHEDHAFVDERFPVTISVTNMDAMELEILVDVLLQPSEDDSVNRIEFAGEQSTGLIKGVSFGALSPGMSAMKALYLTSMGSGGERVLDVSVQSKVKGASEIEVSSRIEHHARAQEHLQTFVVPVVWPFTFSHETTYSRRADNPGYNLGDLDTFEREYWDDMYGGEANVQTTVTSAEGRDSISVIGFKFMEENKTYSKLLHCSIAEETFPQELWPGDDFVVFSSLSLAPPENYFIDNSSSLPEPGCYEISWRRTTSMDDFVAQTRIRLPQIQPPPDRLIALMRLPSTVHLHKPFLLEIVLRNLHQTRTACPSVSLDLDASDAFVVAGLRLGQLPTLLPGAEARVSWQLYPLECGPVVSLPKIRIFNKRKSPATQLGAMSEVASGDADGEEEEVKIVDVRRDDRWSDGNDVESTAGAAQSEGSLVQRFTISVTPS